MISRGIYLYALATASAPVLAQAPATDVAAYVWDLDRTYPSQQIWHSDHERVIAGIQQLQSMKGRAGRSARDLADVMDVMRQTRGLAGKMARFGLLTSSVDSSSEIARSRFDSGASLEARVEGAVIPFETEIRAIGKARVDAWVKSEPRLRSYGHTRRLRRIFMEAAYSAAPAAQSLVGSLERWPRTSADAYELLVDRSIEWPTVADHDGKPSVLAPSTYRGTRRSPDPAVRAAAAKAFSKTVEKHEALFGLLFTRRVEGELAIAKARGFQDSMTAAFTLDDGVPGPAWRRPFQTARANRNVAVRYAGLVARANQNAAPSYREVLARSPWAFMGTYTIGEAMNLVIASHAQFGTAHQEAIRQLYTKPWLHLAPAPHKTGVTGSFIQVGGGNPYGITTFTGDLTSLRNLAAVTQSLMLDFDIPADGWPDRREEDQPAFGNSRWLLAQLLLDDELLRGASQPRERAAILMDQISRLWTEFFYRAALTELEAWVMENVEAGTPPTGAQISAKYLEVMRDYNSHGKGGLTIDDTYAREWVLENTLFLTNHQASFAAAAAGASAMAEALEKRDPQMLRTMRNIRGRNFEYSHDYLVAMGIDLTTDAPYQAIARRMMSKMDQLEKELAAMNL